MHRYRLTCAPSGGTLPHPAAACGKLESSPDLLIHQRTCNTPDVGSSKVTGEFRGQRADSAFGMCGADSGAWQRLAAAIGI